MGESALNCMDSISVSENKYTSHSLCFLVFLTNHRKISTPNMASLRLQGEATLRRLRGRNPQSFRYEQKAWLVGLGDESYLYIGII